MFYRATSLRFNLKDPGFFLQKGSRLNCQGRSTTFAEKDHNPVLAPNTSVSKIAPPMITDNS